MRIHLIAVGSRMPGWIQEGFAEYAGRLPKECALRLQEIPLRRYRAQGDRNRQIAAEGAKMLAAIPEGAYVIALDANGEHWSTPELARRLA